MTIPTSLYIHIPWCVKKCPYCDFNSHQLPQKVDEMTYVKQLLIDFSNDLERHPRERLHSIFIGGGTPSLLSPQAYEYLFNGLQKLVVWDSEIEVSLEANPGTIDSVRFQAFCDLGINRLSLGVQSFQSAYLQKLGRIHDGEQARHIAELAKKIGFRYVNLDLMYGLPGQTVADALFDLQMAIDLEPDHISWYELTIEPNTVFYKTPPKQPSEHVYLQMEAEGRSLLQCHEFQRYEVSAYARPGSQSQHNLNYWLYGDYFGIGAGAHGKLTEQSGCIFRSVKWRMPSRYMQAVDGFYAEEKYVREPQDIVFEFFLNVARLPRQISFASFSSFTGLSCQMIMPQLDKAADQGLIVLSEDAWQLTDLGMKFSNDFVNLFLL